MASLSAIYDSPDCGTTRRYVFRPMKSSFFKFQVKARHDVSLCLSPSPCEVPYQQYEIFLGAWGGGKSGIRRNKNDDVCKMKSPDIISNSQFRGFWVAVTNHAIKVGKEGQSAPFLIHNDPLVKMNLLYYGFCTAWGSAGQWIFEDDNVESETDLSSLGDAIEAFNIRDIGVEKLLPEIYPDVPPPYYQHSQFVEPIHNAIKDDWVCVSQNNVQESISEEPPEYLISQSTLTCLSVFIGTDPHDAIVGMAPYNGGTHQQWFVNGGHWQWGGNRSYCLVADLKKGILKLAEVKDCNTTWTFDQSGLLKTKSQALDVPWQEPRTRVIVYPNHGKINQKWWKLSDVQSALQRSPASRSGFPDTVLKMVEQMSVKDPVSQIQNLGLQWVPCKNGAKCNYAVPVVEGQLPLVAAAEHLGGLIPGVLMPGANVAYIGWNWKVQPKANYYLLSNPGGQKLVWKAASWGTVPAGAIKAGKREGTGETLYISRAKHGTCVIGGKFLPSAGGSHLPYWDKEISKFNYEVLCLTNGTIDDFNDA